MSIIIINSELEYERLNVELPFSHTLNLRNVGLNTRPKPKKKQGADVFRSNHELDAVVSGSNMELGTISPPPHNFELDTVKDIISSRIITFTRYLLNKFDLRNYNPSQVKKHIKLL